jgi:hypothetical protein
MKQSQQPSGIRAILISLASLVGFYLLVWGIPAYFACGSVFKPQCAMSSPKESNEKGPPGNRAAYSFNLTYLTRPAVRSVR